MAQSSVGDAKEPLTASYGISNPAGHIAAAPRLVSLSAFRLSCTDGLALSLVLALVIRVRLAVGVVAAMHWDLSC